MWVTWQDLSSLHWHWLGRREWSEQNKIFRLQHDSRKVEVGDVFIALAGGRFDGHDFIEQAIKAGAEIVITHKPAKEFNPIRSPQCSRVEFIEVQDTLQALWALAERRARDFRLRQKPIVGITGSNGKTTCKEFTVQLLQKLFPTLCVHSNKGSFNNHWGLAFNILSAPHDTDVLVCEMGMNHRHEIAQLCAIAHPSAVVCTMVGTAHIENLGSREGIASAKYEIYQNSWDAVGCYNLSNPWTRKMAERDQRARKIFFQVRYSGMEENPSARQSETLHPVSIDLSAEQDAKGLKVQGQILGLAQELIIPLLGPHQVTNIAAALALVMAVSPEPLDPTLAWQALAGLRTPWGRGQLLIADTGFSILFDGYNANPESMHALLQLLPYLPVSGEFVALLGDMKELGDQAAMEHRRLGQAVAALPKLKAVVFVGSFAPEFTQGYQAGGGDDKKLMISSTYDFSLAKKLKDMLNQNDFVFVKASRSMRMEQWVEALGAKDFVSYPQ